MESSRSPVTIISSIQKFFVVDAGGSDVHIKTAVRLETFAAHEDQVTLAT